VIRTGPIGAQRYETDALGSIFSIERVKETSLLNPLSLQARRRCRSSITGVIHNVRTYPALEIDPESNQAPLLILGHLTCLRLTIVEHKVHTYVTYYDTILALLDQ
jgi:hypothetical protein